MAAKKPTKTANVCATIYEGEFQVDLTCVGVALCRYALCSLMPPDGSEECTFCQHGNCLCPHAKHAALEGLRNRLTKELKQLQED